MCHVQESEEGPAEQVGWTLGLGRVIRPAVCLHVVIGNGELLKTPEPEHGLLEGKLE